MPRPPAGPDGLQTGGCGEVTRAKRVGGRIDPTGKFTAPFIPPEEEGD